MRCPKCGFISFDYLDNCKKCGASLAQIRAELCPLEMPPTEFTIWGLLGVGTGDGKAAEPTLLVTPQSEEIPALEISLEDQTDEIILDDSDVTLELEPSLLESAEEAGASVDASEKFREQPEITLNFEEPILEESLEIDRGERVEAISLDEVPKS
jgi:hypothetical protein